MLDYNSNETVEHLNSSDSQKSTSPTVTKNSSSDNICDPFLNYGLLEVMVVSNSAHCWQDAYILDVDTKVSENTVSDCSTINQYEATVVLAKLDEDPAKTISLMENVVKCPLNHIRFKPQPNDSVDFTLNEFDVVEISSKLDSKYICWKLAKIKIIKGENIAVEFVNPDSPLVTNDPKAFDIVSKNDIRPRSAQSCLSDTNNPFFRFEIPLSQDLLKLLNNDTEWLNNYDLHKEFKKLSMLINVCYNYEKKSLICLGFAVEANMKHIKQEQTIKRTRMLSSMHFNTLKDNYLIFASNVSSYKKFAKLSNDCVIELPIERKFIGLAIGKSGANIQKARKLDGIKYLELDDATCTFLIKGVSKEVCQKAASMLKFKEEEFNFSGKEFSDFFDNKDVVQEIVDRSRIFQINLFTQNKNTPNVLVHLKLIGTQDSIEDFKILLDFQLSEYREIKELKLKYQKLNKILSTQNKAKAHFIFSSGQNYGRHTHANSMPKNFADAVKNGSKY